MNTEINISLKEIEKNINEIICEIGRYCTKQILEEYDSYLMKTRDRQVYRHKGKVYTYVYTLYGKVKYKRNIYEYTKENGTSEFVCLLDEALKTKNKISPNLENKIKEYIETMSYKKTAEELTAQTTHKFSKMWVWNYVQSVCVPQNENKEEESDKKTKIYKYTGVKTGNE